MSTIFCCAHPRSYSPPSELGAAALPVRSLSPSYGRRKIKRTGPGRRHSRQDIEAFYQEGKRLQEVEESHDNTNDTSCLVSSTIADIQYGMSENRTERSFDGFKQAENYSNIPQNSPTPKCGPGKFIVPPVRTSSISPQKVSDHNTRFINPNSQLSPATAQKLFSATSLYYVEGSGSSKDAMSQLSNSAVLPTNETKRQLAQNPSNICRADGKDSNTLRQEPKVNGQFIQTLDIEEVSTLSNSMEGLKTGKQAALGTNPYSCELYCPQPYALSSMYDPELGDIFLKIPKLVGQSKSIFGVSSPLVSTSVSADRDQTSFARATEGCNCEMSMEPLCTLNGRRVHLDSSSSYYTSNASSLRSSIDLAISPVPPIPDAIIAKLVSRQSPQALTSLIPFPQAVSVPYMDNCSYGRIEENKNSTSGLKTDGSQVDKKTNHGAIGVGLLLSDDKDVVEDGGTSLVTHLRKEDISNVKDRASSVWDAGSLRRLLLTDAGKNLILVGDKKWESGQDKLDKRSKTSMHKKSYSNGAITDDIKNWLDEHSIRLSPLSEKKSRSMTFKKTFTKGVSKLRNRLSSNLKPAGGLPLASTRAMRYTATDGRGEFSRLHTPTESVTTVRTTVAGDYINIAAEDVTPNSEQVMANITFTPSLPTELRLDGSLEDYDDFQSAELLVQGNLTAFSTSEPLPIDGSLTALQTAATAAVNQNRYSAIYDECVIIPFLNDSDESGSEEEPRSDSSLTLQRVFPDD